MALSSLQTNEGKVRIEKGKCTMSRYLKTSRQSYGFLPWNGQ